MPATLTLTEPETFHLTYDELQDLLRGQWVSYAIDAELRRHYAELLAAAQAHGHCRYWLLDMRARNWHMPGFGRWVTGEYAAEVRRTLGGPVFIALVLSARHQEAADKARTQALQRGCALHDIYPCLFDSEEAALDWLRYQQSFGEGG